MRNGVTTDSPHLRRSPGSNWVRPGAMVMATTSAGESTFGAPEAVVVCLLGGFRLMKLGRPVSVRRGSKAQALLSNLALRPRLGIPRDELLGLVWPASQFDLAGQSLNTLVSSLTRSLGDALAGRPPVVHDQGTYRLNAEFGVRVDVVEFDAAVDAGDRCARAGDEAGAMAAYLGAASMYGGDLAFGSDIEHVIQRERLRARFLSVRSRLADIHFSSGNYGAALDNALDLLAHDACREDAHRLAMRSYVRMGERAQALRQYRICRQVLAREFDALPEPETERLFESVRLDPSSV